MRLGCHLAELGTADDGKDPEVAADGGDLVTVTACGVLSSSNGHQNIRTSEKQSFPRHSESFAMGIGRYCLQFAPMTCLMLGAIALPKMPSRGPRQGCRSRCLA